MKPFQQYIFELSKPSEFRIKLAGVNPKGEVMERIKNALDAYQLESISAVKSLPIQEHREFPQWGGPCEAWQFDIKVKYPTTNIAMKQVIYERAAINPDWISVRNLNEANYTDDAEALGKDRKGALLDTDELEYEKGAQALVGKNRMGSLIKELESRKFEFAQDSKETGKTTNDTPTNDISPATTAPKRYTPPTQKKAK